MKLYVHARNQSSIAASVYYIVYYNSKCSIVEKYSWLGNISLFFFINMRVKMYCETHWQQHFHQSLVYNLGSDYFLGFSSMFSGSNMCNITVHVTDRLLQYLLGSNASAPPLEPPPGVLHANLSMYSSASKGSWGEEEVMNVLKIAWPHTKHQQNTSY